MDRRAFLSVLAAGLAGCGGGGNSTPTATTTQPSGTAPPSDSASATPTPDGTPHRSTTANVPDVPRTYQEAVRSDLLSASAGTWVSKDKVRWYDSVENRIEWIRPKHETFYQLELTFLAVGEDSVQTPEMDVFKLYVDGEAYPVISALPGNVAWSALRQRPYTPKLTKPNYGDLANRFVDPGKQVSGKLLFDAPKAETPLVQWSHKKSVEGTDKPVYLVPKQAD